MKIQLFVLAVLISVISFGCYAGITGIVVDSETQKPIEGAVVLVEWTKTHGIGDHWTESYKVVEAVSDQVGKVSIEGCYSPFVDPPNVTVYKKGYVAWNSQIVFPNYQQRKAFVWKDQTFSMEHFKSEYSYNEHTQFIRSAIHLGLGGKKLIAGAYEWEESRALEERKDKWTK